MFEAINSIENRMVIDEEWTAFNPPPEEEADGWGNPDREADGRE